MFQADILGLKKAITSAVDIMQAMASSICYLLPKVTCWLIFHLICFFLIWPVRILEIANHNFIDILESYFKKKKG